MQEIWKDIIGYENLYKVSNLGRVKSLHNGKERILKQAFDGWGYLIVSLCKNGINKTPKVHRLVAEAFIPNPNKLSQINHIDEDKTNNCIDNLEWCTNKYNQRYSNAKQIGCYKDGKLVKVYDAILDVEQDGYNHRNISSCCNHRYGYKTAHGFEWRFI